MFFILRLSELFTPTEILFLLMKCSHYGTLKAAMLLSQKGQEQRNIQGAE